MSSQNINISLKHKPINGSSAMSYSPSSHTMPAIFQHRDSFVHQRELESAFCSDLVCCGMRVRDLHELLHHYEEHHHAPIEEEPEPKEEEMMDEDEEDDDYPIPLPTQPHELAALTSSPLLRKTVSPPVEQQQMLVSPTVNGQHTEEILKALNTHHPTGDLQYFRSEALYQTCEGCEKAYKNPNGLKYHQMHGHSEEDSLSDAERDAQKPYMCTIGYCNKRYKNLNGLKYHIEHSHIAKLKQYPQEHSWPTT
ncbi:hypothetical protein INT47_013160 [Mucor saturninus]|uniref:C2H2-type domain-containing protein n=1 Tax=Mucor saturninus TaxID=64648 RepID=A0A8H7QWS2_9FUNG|nr:hypothetical protein INT47_013160 [Mucor saturninus]